MKDKSTSVEYTREELEGLSDETDWAKVDAMTDEEVYQDALGDPDAQPTDAAFWATAQPPDNFLCIEPDILAWFKRETTDYEALINKALLHYIEAHQ